MPNLSIVHGTQDISNRSFSMPIDPVSWPINLLVTDANISYLIHDGLLDLKRF